MKAISRLLAFLVVCALAWPAEAGALLAPRPASDWRVDEWINGNPGRTRDLRGKVVIIEFFQLWCPASNAFSLPLLRQWEEKYAGRQDLQIVSIHSVFEGHDEQTPERLRLFVEEQGITRPVGVDHHEQPDDDSPVTMENYEAEGTPQIVIIDKDGLIRFSHFGPFDPAPVEFFIDRLLRETPGEEGPASASPSSGPATRKKTTRRR